MINAITATISEGCAESSIINPMHGPSVKRAATIGVQIRSTSTPDMSVPISTDAANSPLSIAASAGLMPLPTNKGWSWLRIDASGA